MLQFRQSSLVLVDSLVLLEETQNSNMADIASQLCGKMVTWLIPLN